MSFLIFNFILLSLLFSNPKTPKDLVWKHRVLIIQSSELDSVWFQDNLKEDLTDRKLLIFHFQQGTLLKTNFEEKIDSGKFLEKLKNSDEMEYRWALIGLDGGVKNLGKSNPLPLEIFRIIDSMPMRSAEIRKSGK
ncbi:DUF4174 domain-containing protein [Algoriphagus boritolerans]|uniref:DUF4174 domain-containing protein n=1 Tax=Algoriphagus boritolerans DSM 17298 = JCM 18970 TaxID=1120964 RepID=A0A1H5S4A6_9BACT|nr:DUF4174 domain-containing protein [Algoriphagus boritolerans]SEF45442.1 protein of unknown function [Algoriphagus boritolerans DSM 17298 = JCM 18970]